jgi:hypothetical protein
MMIIVTMMKVVMMMVGYVDGGNYNLAVQSSFPIPAYQRDGLPLREFCPARRKLYRSFDGSR